MEDRVVIQPQEGYQMQALSSPADIVIGGGMAGAGKTFSLLLDPLRHINNKNFGGVIFRRLTTQIKAEGGLWDESKKLYPLAGANPNQTELQWKFNSGAKIKFSHLEHEKNVTSWQGAQIPFIGFDELTHFSKNTFFYLLSRNRSTCGVKPYLRATCNPDPDGWVAELISWWIGSDGFPIPDRQGIIRYFVKDGEKLIWGDTIGECLDRADYFITPLVEASGIKGSNFVKSITFISGSIYENRKLLDINPEYLANLAAQDEQTRMQLLEGNWKIAINPSDIYKYTTFKDFFTNTWAKGGEKCITVDVAMMGINKLVIMYHEGERMEDIEIVAKSSGKDVLDQIKTMQQKHGVPNSKVVYDANGVGAFIGGGENAFIPNSIAFDNAGKAFIMQDGRRFKNLKAQCYFLDGEKIDQYISPNVADKMYDDKMTVRQRLLFERKAIKKKISMDEEPLSLISKSEMKEKYLNGDSPDLLDAKMMKRIFDVKNIQILVFKQAEWSMINEVPEKAKRIPSGIKFGWSPDPTVICDFYIDGDDLIWDEIIYETELISSKSDSDNSIQKRLVDAEFDKTHLIVAELESVKDISELRESHYNLHAIKKILLPDGIRLLKRFNHKITTRSVNIINEFKTFQKQVDDLGNELNEYEDKDNHAIKAATFVQFMKGMLW